MRRIAGATAAFVIVVALALLSLAAPAVAKTNTTKYCQTYLTFANDLSTNPSSSDKANAARVQKGLNKMAGYASGSLKSATKTLADVYGKIAKGATSSVLAGLASKDAAAAGKVSTFVTAHCPAVALASTTTTKPTSSGGNSSGATTTTGAAGTASALECTADRGALDGAEIAYNALNRHYTDMQTLVSSGLLAKASTLHTITLTGGPTNATAYQIVGC
jgi:hypothetical protein